MSRFIISFSVLSVVVWSMTCKDIAQTNNDVPCIEISKCKADANHEIIVIDQLSNGLGKSGTISEIQMCYDNENVYVKHVAKNQQYLTKNQYTECNSGIFNSDVIEMFIAPAIEQNPHCYNELDLSPFNIPFQAGIYNPNLNQTGIVGSDFGCESDFHEFKHATNTSEFDSNNSNSWSADMSFSWDLINCPHDCPLSMYCKNPSLTALNVDAKSKSHSSKIYDSYRVNFYRINELTETTLCNSSICEYLAWNPTLANPPAFHVPTKFGYLVPI